jgi:hypothetical protein
MIDAVDKNEGERRALTQHLWEVGEQCGLPLDEALEAFFIHSADPSNRQKGSCVQRS